VDNAAGDIRGLVDVTIYNAVEQECPIGVAAHPVGIVTLHYLLT
jgi:hypothetical protein